MTEYLDGNGRALTDYSRPSLAVDTVVFTVDTRYKEMCIALVKTPEGQDALPGTFLHEGETLEEAAQRALREKLGLTGLSPVQLHVFDSLERDPRGWVISVAHIAVVPIEQLRGVPLTILEDAEDLAFDHDAMVAKALERVRSDYSEKPDPWNLLETFTLKELREVHEAIDPDTPLRDSFRRLMQPLVVDTGEMSSGSVGKPSRVWRKETEPERVLRKYAKYERPLTSRESSSTKSSARSRRAESPVMEMGFLDTVSSISSESISTERNPRDYIFEIEWRSGDRTQHENLSLGQAQLRFKEFLAEAQTGVWQSLPLHQHPHLARIKDQHHNVMQQEIFI
jgi:ADP-ribose pyrophosphatase YjhB (NUDIX family)